MAHGYLGDGYGTHGEIDPDHGDHDRSRDRQWRERGWQGGDDWTGRGQDRRMMFQGRGSDWSDGDRSRQGGWPAEDRWSVRGGSYGRERGFGRNEGDDHRRRNEGFGDYSEGRRLSANPDDHYRSWRDRHMSELDRDYADYCREREQQFHRDFSDWRRSRKQASSGNDEAIAQAGELELTHERALAEEGNTPSPVEEATLGTNNSENTFKGRARPRP